MRRYVEGKQVDNPPTILKIFGIMEHTRWTHLPVPGGLYDQHPDFLEQLAVVFEERDKYREKEQKRREAESRKGGGRVAGGRRR